MLPVSSATRHIWGIIQITVPTIEYGEGFLLKMLRKREADKKREAEVWIIPYGKTSFAPDMLTPE